MPSNACHILRVKRCKLNWSVYLQILLNYLPPDRRQWKGLLEEKRAAYQQFKQELIIDPKKQEHSAAADHPLSQSSDSRWNAYFKVSVSACGDSSQTPHMATWLFGSFIIPQTSDECVQKGYLPAQCDLHRRANHQCFF